MFMRNWANERHSNFMNVYNPQKNKTVLNEFSYVYTHWFNILLTKYSIVVST